MLIVVTQAWRLLNVTISSTMQKHFNHSTIYLSIYKKGTLNFPFWNLLFWIANKWWNVNKVGRMGNKLLVKHLRKWTTAFWQRPQQLHTLTKKKKLFFCIHPQNEESFTFLRTEELLNICTATKQETFLPFVSVRSDYCNSSE